MQYFLVRVAYTAEAWRQQLETPTASEARLRAVRGLIRELGGSLPEIRFLEVPGEEGKGPITADGKLIGMGADHLVTVLALPDADAAHAFTMAVAAESGIRNVELTPMLPHSRAMEIMARAAQARKASAYSAPGGTETGWRGAAAPARRRRATRGQTGRGSGAE